MKVRWIANTYRDADHKFVKGNEYEMTAAEAKAQADKIEIIKDKPKAEVKTDGNS